MRAPALPLRLAASVAALALTLGACDRGTASTKASADLDAGGSTSSSTTETTVAETTTSSTTAKPTTTTTAKPVFSGYSRGSKGPEVQGMEQRLGELGYELGKVDGTFDAMTGHGVMAFQKAEGLPRTGKATPDVLERLKTAERPGPLLPAGGANRVEVDLKRQILLLWKGGNLERVISVSTGNGKRYCVEGDCDTAVTPGGSFRVNRKIKGLRISRLGELWNPLYFNGGIAIHGSTSIPAYPASHGCVRIPMSTSEWFFGAVPSGTPVYVVGGPKAPVPFNEPAPGEAPPNSSTTTTTEKPASTTTTPTSAPATTTTTAQPTTTTTTSTPPPSTP
jgi:lipoprotein-anchoring transpeptidase ErfK/SrfK